jgi:PKD repeat protein
VLVTDPATLMLDYPSFSASLFETSFSLLNTGEPLVLRDTGGVDVDSISYTSAQGANGDGKTLHRAGVIFSSGAASPGTEPGLVATSTGTGGATVTGTADTNATPPDTTTPPTSVTTIFHTVTIEPPAQLFVRTLPTLSAASGSVVQFSAEAYNAKGSSEDAQYTWVYGDGMRDGLNQSSQKSVTHIYKHAGEYEAVVTATRTGLTGEARVHVVVRDSPLVVTLAEEDTLVSIENTGTVPVDLTGMRLMLNKEGAQQNYTFPDKTRVLAKQKLTLALADIGLTDRRMPRDITLISADTSRKVSVQGTVGTALPVQTAALRVASTPMTLLGYGAQVPIVHVATVAPAQSARNIVAIDTPEEVHETNEVHENSNSPTLKENEGASTTKEAPHTAKAPHEEKIVAAQPIIAEAAEKPVLPNKSQTAATSSAVPSVPLWMLSVAGLALLATGLYTSWVIGENPQ